MDAQFTTLGAIIGLVIAIILIIKKVQPAYSLIFGALIGGLIGGGGLNTTVTTMVSGAGSMMSSVLRILTSGILAGALIKTGSAEKIAETIVEKLGEKRAVIAIAVADMIICAVGVFVDISVITVAPIALAIGKRAGLSRSGILIAMIGGGKAGNIISPNPNTIAVSEAFEQDLTSVMARNIIPAICALIVTIILASILVKKPGEEIQASDLEGTGDKQLPGFLPAILGPAVVIIMLALRPIAGIAIDPLIALPVGGAVSTIATGKAKHFIEYTEFGLTKVIGVSILLIGTGTITGIIKGNGTSAFSAASASDEVTLLGTNAVNRATADASGNDIANTYAKKTDISGMYKYKGSVADDAHLPTTGQETGDVYNIESAGAYGGAGANVAWNGTAWDSLGEIFNIEAITNSEIDTIVAS